MKWVLEHSKLLRRKKSGNESGQAAIEFIMVVIVVFFFLFFCLSLAFLLVLSDYIQYATFMAARTYKTGFASVESQERFAERVFRGYTDKIDTMARDFTIDFRQVDSDDNQTAGVVTTYNMDLFYLPPIFVTGDQPPSEITLSSEALLGRDPPFNECVGFFEEFANRMNINIGGSGLVNEMDDNGC